MLRSTQIYVRLFTCSSIWPLQEPDLLQEEKAQVERSLQTTAVTQYGAFISTAKCLETISTELTAVCEHLDLLLDVSPSCYMACMCCSAYTRYCGQLHIVVLLPIQGIPELAASCESFSQKSAQVLEQHTQNKHLASEWAPSHYHALKALGGWLRSRAA
jgi:hypothetical protein